MANDFLSKLLQLQDNRPAIPLMDPNADDEPKQEDFEPAQELPAMPKPDLAKRQEILNQYRSFRAPAEETKPADESELEQHLNKMDKNNDKRLDDEMSSADFDQQAMTGSPEEVTPSSLSTKAQTLSDYQRLMEAQAQRRKDMAKVGLLDAGNTIAQGFARGRGAEVGNDEAGLKALREQANLPVTDIQEQMKLGGTDMNDPHSDISKFTRAQAYALLKKIAPEEDYSGKLDNMSAAQLAKLPGMKNVLGQQGRADWVATDRVNAQGHPIKFNKMTGTYVDGVTGLTVDPNDTLVRDIARKDELTGQYGYVSRNGGMQVMPTNYNAAQVKPKATVNDEGETVQAEEPKYSDFAKAAPKQADEFRKMQKEFNQDMKDSRDVATAVTNLASKLKPGPNGKIDSGVLGSIQTQAAKMAGQKGVLTDQDLVKFAGAGGVGPKIERIIDGTFFGEMSDSDVKFFKRFGELMAKSLDTDIQNRAQLYKHQARQLVETTVPGVSDDTIGEWLGVDKVAPIAHKTESDTVQIQGPSGQVVTMKKDAAEKYLKKPGYKLVQ